jgi:hypothetical protein
VDAMYEIENLVDESGMITTKDVVAENQSKAEFYNYLKKIILNRYHVVSMFQRMRGLIRY